MSRRAALRAAKRRDPEALAGELMELSEKDRRSLHDELMALTKAVPGPNRPRDPDLDRCHFLVLYGTGTVTDVRNAISAWRFAPESLIAEVVAVRPQKTVDGFVKAALSRDWDVGPWFIVRDLVRAGVIDRPETEAYYEHLVGAVSMTVERGVGPAAEAIVARLRDDPELADELLVALEQEGPVNRLSGAYTTELWLCALERSVRFGIFARSDMLDLALRQQTGDRRKSATAFFRKLFEGFEPDQAEIDERLDQLVRIVAMSNPAEQAAALKTIRTAVGAGSIAEPGALAAAVINPLTGTHKAAAMQALRLIDAGPMSAQEQAEAAVHGLGHPHADVQERALDVIERCGDDVPPGVKAEALSWLDTVTPALRERLSRVTGLDVATPESQADGNDLARRLAEVRQADDPQLAQLVAEAARGELPPPLRVGPAVAPTTGRPVLPIDDVDDLVATVVAVIGGSGTALDLERVIDGLARHDPSHFSTSALSPIRAAVRSTEENWYTERGWRAWAVREYVALAAMHWTLRRPPPTLPYLAAATRPRRWSRRTASPLAHDLVDAPQDATWFGDAAFDGSTHTAGLTGFVGARLWEAVHSALGSPRPILALPSTDDGWLAAEDLADRLARHHQHAVPLGRFDAVQALLRLRPGEHVAAVGTKVDHVMGMALRSSESTPVLAGDPALDRAIANRARPVEVQLPTFPAVDYEPALTTLHYALDRDNESLRRDDPVGQLLAELEVPTERPRVGWRWSTMATALSYQDGLLLEWSCLGLPRHRDVVAACAASLLAEDPDANRSSDCLHTLLTAQTDPDAELGLGAHALLAVGLSDRNVVTSSAAADLLHDAAVDGRLDAALLGELLARLSNAGLAKPNRFAKAAAAVVGSSALVAERIRQVLVRWLGLVDGVPRDLHEVLATLEVACDVAATGVSDSLAVAKLEEAGTGSSKRAASAKRLLALSCAAPATAAAQAGHALLDRSERWRSAQLAQ